MNVQSISGDPEPGQNWNDQCNNSQTYLEPGDYLGLGQNVVEHEEDDVDVVSKSFHSESSGIRKRRRSSKNAFKIIIARELMKRYLKYNDIRSLNDLRAISPNMTREERFSLFNVFTSLVVNGQDEQISSRKNTIIPIIFGINFNIDKLPNYDMEDVNVT